MFDPIKQNNTGFFKKTTVKDTTKVLAKKSSDILTNMLIAAQQRNTNEVPELLKWEVALPPPSLTIPSAVKFATKPKGIRGRKLGFFYGDRIHLTMMLFSWTGP